MGEESGGPPGAEPEERDCAKRSEQDAAHEISSKWEPSAQQLKQMLARHAGWLVNRHGAEAPQPLPEYNAYLEDVDPAIPNGELKRSATRNRLYFSTRSSRA